MSNKFYETLITLRVLSDREIHEPGGPEATVRIAAECVDGDFVGEMVSFSSSCISTAHMGEALVRAGSEPGFFGIPDLVATAELLRDSLGEDAADLSDLLELAELDDQNNQG